jgi:hypothetical protein
VSASIHGGEPERPEERGPARHLARRVVRGRVTRNAAAEEPEREESERKVDEKDPAPRRVRDDEPAERRADREPDADHRAERAERAAPLGFRERLDEQRRAVAATSAAASPWTTRSAINAWIVGASPHRSEAAVKTQ